MGHGTSRPTRPARAGPRRRARFALIDLLARRGLDARGEGQRVALLCYLRGLGRFLQRVTSAWPARYWPAYGGLFHDLALEWGAPPADDDAPASYWESTLPQALGDLAASRAPEVRFDAVVVDEAQDFGEAWWASTLACLRDPAAGGLFVFLDGGWDPLR